MHRKESRRSIVKWAAMAGVASALPRSLMAAGVGDRVAVMIVLVGGNDSNNMIVPYDDAAYSTYARARGILALPKSSLLPVVSARQKANFGFHPAMADVQRLYSSGRLAVLANQGYIGAPGAKGDLQTDINKHLPGQQIRFTAPATAFTPWAIAKQRPSDDPNDKRPQAFMFGPVGALSLDRPKIGPDELRSAMEAVRVNTRFPDTYIGRQLLTVAKLIDAAPGVGFSRANFTAMMDGFDTHDDQMARQNVLFTELSQALGAFHDALSELGSANRVTVFTQTEFNRTLAPNAWGGTEHGWGGHQLVSGSVAGGDIYGTFPYADGPENLGGGGIFRPTATGEDYLGMVGRWHGVNSEAATAPREFGMLL
jgi:uncharacterized protein (DUF1501 family)